MSHSSLVRLLVLGLVLCAWAGVANAAFLTADGDVANIWPGSGQTLSSAGQSPFTNVFANNALGMKMGSIGYGLQYPDPAPPDQSGLYYLNADFALIGTAATPRVSLKAGFGALYSYRIINLCSDDNLAFYAETDTGYGDPITTMTKGTWYNVQLVIDTDANTYSGQIKEWGGATTAISSRNFVQILDEAPIGCIWADQFYAKGIEGQGTEMDANRFYYDNFVLGDAPLDIPEPGTLALLGTGLLGLLAYAWRKRK